MPDCVYRQCRVCGGGAARVDPWKEIERLCVAGVEGGFKELNGDRPPSHEAEDARICNDDEAIRTLFVIPVAFPRFSSPEGYEYE